MDYNAIVIPLIVITMFASVIGLAVYAVFDIYHHRRKSKARVLREMRQREERIAMALARQGAAKR